MVLDVFSDQCGVYLTLLSLSTFSSLPVFIQVQQPWRQMYCGTSVMPEMSIEFDVLHLSRIPQQYSHLAGLLDVFKSKLVGCNSH